MLEAIVLLLVWVIINLIAIKAFLVMTDEDNEPQEKQHEKD